MRLFRLYKGGDEKQNGSRKFVLLAFFVLSACRAISAELPQLSRHSIVSIVTCSPTSAYEGAFGHSAIRLQDDSLKIDVIFNFGMYDPQQSHFFYKVLLGKLESSLEGEAFYRFAERYRKEGRGVREYYLDLTLPERQRLWEGLNKILLSDHRTYRFNVTRSNCSTHVRDVLFEQLNLNVSAYKKMYPGYTFRDFELQSPIQNPWFHLLFNLVVGAPADEPCSIFQSALSPDGLVMLLQAVNDTDRPLVVAAHEVFPVETAKKVPDHWMTLIVFSGLLIFSLSITYTQWKKKKSFVWFDRVLFFASGMLGIFLLSLMIFSEIPELKINAHLLWSMPTNLILAFMIKKRPDGSRWTLLLARFSGICILLFLLLSLFECQYVPPEVYLLALALLARLAYYSLKFK